MPLKKFATPREFGTDKPVKVRALKNMAYQGKDIKAGDTFTVPDWQVNFWMTSSSPGIAKVKGAAQSAPAEPEAKDDTPSDKKTDAKGKKK